MAPKRKAGGGKPAGKTVATTGKETTKEESKEGIKETPTVVPPPPVKGEEPGKDKPQASKRAKVEKTPQKKKTPGKKGRKSKASPKKQPATIPKGTTTTGNVSIEAAESTKEPKVSTSLKVIIIEASTVDNSFKTKATKLESGLKEAVPGLIVKVNPEQPRKGCFEIHDGEGTIFVSLKNVSKPFGKVKNLDVDKTIKEIAAKIV
eukprot:c21126_g1_i1 orf=256-870(+)